MTDGQWKLTAPLIPEANPGGRPRKASSAIINAILYFLRAGMAWRLLRTTCRPGGRSTTTSDAWTGKAYRGVFTIRSP
ncbi:transposase [Constrictibacter sp. MBR-5]|uniref:transposase n=1 Tax=Constrictibacter sp. MBR-5 TaxID=3156467 RepID=UPI003396A6E3